MSRSTANSSKYEQHLFRRSSKFFNKYAPVLVCLLEEEFAILQERCAAPRITFADLRQRAAGDVSYQYIQVREYFDKCLAYHLSKDAWKSLIFAFLAYTNDVEHWLTPWEVFFLRSIAYELKEEHLEKLQSEADDNWIVRRVLIISMGFGSSLDDRVPNPDRAITDNKKVQEIAKAAEDEVHLLYDSSTASGMLAFRALHCASVAVSDGRFTPAEWEITKGKVLAAAEKMAEVAAGFSDSHPSAHYYLITQLDPPRDKIFASAEYFANLATKWAGSAPRRSLTRVNALRMAVIATALHALRKFRTTIAPSIPDYIDTCISYRNMYTSVYEMYLDAMREAALYYDMSDYTMSHYMVALAEMVVAPSVRCTVCWVQCTKEHPHLLCSRCRLTWYCSPECQRIDWECLRHMDICAILVENEVSTAKYARSVVQLYT